MRDNKPQNKTNNSWVLNSQRCAMCVFEATEEEEVEVSKLK